jgi:trimethylamine--corrinoid protein Co-methyltransferase
MLRLLSDDDVDRIHRAAMRILEKTGVMFRSREALAVLGAAGARIDEGQGRAMFPPEMVMEAVSKCPSSLQLYTSGGSPAAFVGGEESHYAPGSTALNFGDGDGRDAREATSADLRDIARLVEGLPNIHLQSTAVVACDVPREIADLYRLYIVLCNSSKPVITGAFSVQGLVDMKDMLSAVAGGDDALRAKPFAVFDVCPSPPLMWTEISAGNIMDCARFGLPLELISMPLSGANAPCTVAGSVVQHTAETLSGIVLAQAVKEGATVIYGGAPSLFDMRHGTTPMGSVETMMIDICYAQMGKFYGLPTHTYSATTDAKVLDMQAGLESSLGSVLCALAGINIISGPGMYDFLTCQSLVKLAVDNEICGMVYRFTAGVDASEEAMASELIESAGPGANFLSSPHTLRFFKGEQYVPGPAIDRRDRKRWLSKGGKDTIARAADVVSRILGSPAAPVLTDEARSRLDEAVRRIARRHGIRSLPLGPDL